MAHDVFISYSSKDKPTADAACATLENRGIRCWIAPRDIVPGADWGASIIEAINGARATVLVFSANANLSQQIKREVERAINLMPVIPLRIENIAPENTLEFFLSTPHWLDAFTPPLEHHLNYLADVIQHILEGEPVPKPPPPPLPPWWRGPMGLAAGAAALLVIGGIAWFSFFRPPPSFVGTWTSTSLDLRQYGLENSMIGAEVPSPMLTAALKNPDTKGTLTIDPSGQYVLNIIAEDHGTVVASPVDMTNNFTDNSVTFTSDITHQALTTNLVLFQNGTGYQVQTDPPPNGQTAFTMMLMPQGQQSGAPSGSFAGKPKYVGTPDSNGGLRTIDVIAGTWGPIQFNQPPSYNSGDQSNAVTVSLKITPDGHYTMDYTLHEKSLWHAANGNWTRDIPSFGVISAPGANDSGTYTFNGSNEVTLYDQTSTSSWQRGS